MPGGWPDFLPPILLPPILPVAARGWPYFHKGPYDKE